MTYKKSHRILNILFIAALVSAVVSPLKILADTAPTPVVAFPAINDANVTAVPFTVTNAEIPTATTTPVILNYTITDGTGNIISGTTTIGSDGTANFTLNLSSLDNGSINIHGQFYTVDVNGLTSATIDAFASKETTMAPTPYVSFPEINYQNVAALPFSVGGAEIPTATTTPVTLYYTITDGGSHTTTGTGTIAPDGTANVTVNFSLFANGTENISGKFYTADVNGLTSPTVTVYLSKDTAIAPTPSVSFPNVTDSNVTAVPFTVTGAELPTATTTPVILHYTIFNNSTPGITITGTTTTAGGIANFNLNLSPLANGTLHGQFYTTDVNGLTSGTADAFATKSTTVAPTPSVSFPNVTDSNVLAVPFAVTGAEIPVATTTPVILHYSITDSATPANILSGTKTISATGTANFNLNLSSLKNGTLHGQFYTVDNNGLTSPTADAFATKSTAVAPTPSVSFPNITDTNVTAVPFTVTGAEIPTASTTPVILHYAVSDSATPAKILSGTTTIAAGGTANFNLNFSGLANGLIQGQFYTTDVNGMTSDTVLVSATKNTTVVPAPTVIFSDITDANVTAVPISVSNSENPAATTTVVTLHYSIFNTLATSTAVTGTQTLASGAVNFNVNLSTLANGLIHGQFYTVDSNGLTSPTTDTFKTKNTGGFGPDFRFRRPPASTVGIGNTIQFTATGLDQYGNIFLPSRYSPGLPPARQ